MERYYLTVTGGGSGSDSPVELEAASMKEAHILAIRRLGELLADDGSSFWRDSHMTVEVRNAADLVVFRIHVLGSQAPLARSAAAF